MNEELTELQKIWKEYPRKKSHSRQVLEEIKKTDQKDKINNLLKTGVFLVTVGFLIYIFFEFQFITVVANIGFAIICISIVIHSFLMWWIQTIKYEEKVRNPVKDVFHPAIRKLTLKKYFFKYFIPFLAFELTTGINLIYLEIFVNHGLVFRLMIHTLVTVILLLTFYLGWKKHLQKIVEKTDPLIIEIKKEQKKLTLEL